MTNVILRGKTYAGNSHVRFEEGNSASAEPRRNSLRLRKLLAMVAAGFIVCPLFGTLSDGLIAYYKFDGNANDSSGNGHHLTNVGAAKLVTGRKGDANGAYEFNGTSTSKLSADPAVVVQNNFSYSLWFQTSVAMSAHGGSGTAWNPGNDIIHSGFADYEYVGSGLRVGTDGLAIVEHGGMYRSTVFQYTKDIGINWHHVAVVVASGRGEVVYLDGEYVGEAEINDSTLTSFHGNGARAIHLEADGVGGGQWGYYTGCIDDLRIYNRTLSSAEVKALYDGDSAPEVTKCAVTGVIARQRYPWNGLVDVVVTLQGSVENVAKADCLFAATNSATKAAIPVEHITRNGDDTGSGTVWTRKFIWDAKADVGAVKIDDVALAVDVGIPLGGVQLWENGPYWAECNVGAKKPEECGYYFWWGDTVGYERNANNDGWISVKDSTSYSFSDCPTRGKNNSQLQSDGYIDATGNLVAKYDAATAHLGASWRMPTDAEFSALINNCDTEWTSRNGVSGRLVKGRGAYSSKSIFLPAAGDGYDSRLYNLGSGGYSWSSTPNSDYSSYAWYLDFDSGSFGRDDNVRYYGQSVRPVRGFASSSVAVGGVTTHLSLDCSVGTVSVTGVTARQRYPWNGLVDITVTLQGSVENVAKADCLFAATNSATKAAIPVEHVTRNGDDAGSGNVWTRKFIWAAKVDVGAVKIDDVALAVDVEIPLGGVQLWENGPYWAECNVGATKPEEYGYYFWWGDTVGYKRNASNNGWISVKDSTSYSFSGCPTCGKNNSQLQSDGYIDETGNLVAKYDAATAHLGAPWRMPTNAEFFALVNNCTTTWTTRNGVSGRLVTGKGAYSSKSIFLPAAGYGDDSTLNYLGSYGYYWSSTPSSDYSNHARNLFFYSGGFYRDYDYRPYGRSVRPVRGFAK